jgi:hypothetical protein
MAKDDRRSSTLLRHRFSSVEQLKAHLHAVDGRSVLFFRDPTLMIAPGAPVLLEILFAQSEQTRVVRSTLVARTEGQGSWLAMPNTRFARDVQDRGLVQRRWRRVGTDRPMRARWPDGSEQMVTLLDLSIAGARIGGGLSRGLEPGCEVDLRLASAEVGLSPDLGRATVVWSQDGEAGLQFDRASTTCRVSVGRLFQLLQQQWEKSRSVDHVHGCCAGGALLEPPLPRLRVDGKNDAARAKTG